MGRGAGWARLPDAETASKANSMSVARADLESAAGRSEHPNEGSVSSTREEVGEAWAGYALIPYTRYEHSSK